MNLREAAEAMGLYVYDTSMPQSWVDEVRERFGHRFDNPYGHVVWCYDHARTWGEPVGIDDTGKAIVAAMNAVDAGKSPQEV